MSKELETTKKIILVRKLLRAGLLTETECEKVIRKIRESFIF